MKKILFLNLIALVPFLIYAQDIAYTKTVAMPSEVTTASDPTASPVKTTKTARREARESKQLDKTHKQFSQDFKDASNVNWSTGAKEFTASFTKDGMSHVAYYSKSGGLRYSMISYGADKLPAEEQRVIRNDYDGYKITWVNEVHQNDLTVYVVHLENESEIKLVTVCDGAINTYQQFKKQ